MRYAIYTTQILIFFYLSNIENISKNKHNVANLSVGVGGNIQLKFVNDTVFFSNFIMFVNLDDINLLNWLNWFGLSLISMIAYSVVHIFRMN